MPISRTTQEWLDRYYQHVDSKNIDGFTAMLADDAMMTFANADPVVGREQIRSVLAGLLDSVAGIEHDLRGCHDLEDGLVVFECDVHYHRHDQKTITVPGAGFFVLGADGLCHEQRILVDVSPVFA